MLAPPVPPSMIVPNQTHMETQVAQVTMTAQMPLRTGFSLSFFSSLTFYLLGMFWNTLSIKNEIASRYLTRSPPSGPVNGAPRRQATSRKNQHRQLPVPPASTGSARVQNIPPKGYPPAKTATEPTTAGGVKRRHQA